MNGAQRILNTLTGQPVDRCAFAPILSLYGARLTECPLETYYRDPEAYARGQVSVVETFAPDIIFGPFDFPSLGAAFGSQLRFYKEQAPNVRRPVLNSYLEWDQLKFPDPEDHPQLRFTTQAIRLMAEKTHGETLISACLPPVIDLPAMILGMEGWLEAIVTDRAAAVRIIRSLMAWHKRVARSLYAAGANVIALPCAFASPTVVTRDIAQSMMRPFLEEFLTDFGGPVVLHHGGAPILDHLNILKSLPSVAAYFLDEMDSLAEARMILGPGPTLMHGPQAAHLASMTAAEIEASCSASIDQNGGTNFLVLGNSGPDVPWTTPSENIHAIRKAAESAARHGAT